MNFAKSIKLQALALLLLGCALAVPAMAQVTVGEYVNEAFGPGTDYPAPPKRADGQAELVWADLIYYPGATYLAPHFDYINLPAGDTLVLRSEDNSQYWTYELQGRRDLGVKDGFFATHIKGDKVVVELYSAGGTRGRTSRETPYGFSIDYYARGYSEAEIDMFWSLGLGETMNLPRPLQQSDKSICGSDNSREAKCYQSTEPDVYNAGRAVARHWLNGVTWCTAWLWGCDGQIMTNYHCIANQTELDNSDFEFMAEGGSCSTNCTSRAACGGVIEASGGTFLAGDYNLDYALIDPGTGSNLSNTYGYLQARSSGPALGEQIYIVGHPAGWGKRISFESSHSADNGFARVQNLNDNGCRSGSNVGYYADTQGGSSGSPVLAYSDHAVVALHDCGGCTNTGVAMDLIVADVGSSVPACGTTAGTPPPPPPPPPACLSVGASCTSDSECCSNKCKGKPGNKTCK